MVTRTPELVKHLKGQKPQKLFHILNKLEDYGVGRRVTRVIWKQEDLPLNTRPSYWTITRVTPHKVVEIVSETSISV